MPMVGLGDPEWRGWSGLRRRGESPLVQLVEELILGVGYGLGVESGDLGGGFRLADSGSACWQ